MELKSIYNKVLFTSATATTQREILAKAIKEGANLRDANLRDANLHGANLRNADLQYADLQYADLHGAYLQDANLHGAYLHGANLRDANLRSANLQGANLQYADLRNADLRNADLQYANLRNADLQYADLQYADLRDADLRDAKNFTDKLTLARLRIVPDGAIVGWKKCQLNVIVKLEIPTEAGRVNSTGRKCRAEFVKVLEVVGAEEAYSGHDYGKTVYRVGEIVRPDSWNPDFREECTNGIHFFLTREEAEAY